MGYDVARGNEHQARPHTSERNVERRLPLIRNLSHGEAKKAKMGMLFMMVESHSEQKLGRQNVCTHLVYLRGCATPYDCCTCSVSMLYMSAIRSQNVYHHLNDISTASAFSNSI